MDYMDKLTCKEEVLDISDVETSANDDIKDTEDIPKKKKRRRREIDMIKLSDDDESDDDSGHKRLHIYSPGSNSPAAHREPRTCVLKASQKRRPLSRLLEQLLRNLEKKDPNQHFAWPVNDNFAPGYSKIIRKPMDFSTIKQKIDDNEYKSLNCFISDFKLMCNNAMKYNKMGTVYHKAARRLLHAGLKQLAPAKLRPLGALLTYMYEIPMRELGFDIGKMDVQKVLKRSSPIKSGGEENDVQSDSASSRQDAADGDSVKMQMEAAREMHRRKLAKKAFPRMDGEGKTTMCIVSGEAEDKQMSLKQYVGKLAHGTGTLSTARENQRNLVRGVRPLYYGPFSSHAPAHDSTFATLTKDQSHLLYHTLPSELGQGNEELLRFEPDSPWTAIYDMEAMFPVRKPPVEPELSNIEQDLASVKVDLDALRSLSELGIDVEFLNELEDDIAFSQHDYGITPTLQHSLQLLTKLEKEQRDRLSATPPWHLSLCARANAAEREAARGAAGLLKGMLSKVTPRHMAPLTAVRAALGVTLQHLDTPVSVDDFSDLDASELTAGELDAAPGPSSSSMPLQPSSQIPWKV